MANLIKNGDFSQEGNEWTASNPDNVFYESGYCLIGLEDYITQDVIIGNGGMFKLSAKLKTEDGFGSKVSVETVPSGEKFDLLHAGGGEDWFVAEKNFTVQAGTLKLIVKLQADDGVIGGKGAYFDDLELLRESV
ncbi:hypothetical protein [Pseudomonas fluorescens]|uniref:CBM6 domain-containing protein n=1 Tax=Pseudomonas fluorescens TaxID=294 RepID=A0A5E6UPH2_PSEFL|nr:hypothetical protein [Pseudomonas fluorescens]VVN04944.1 hypothetical protein PS655_03539 [Pseudomonas fluorescens]